MKVTHLEREDAKVVEMDGARKVTVKVPITEKDGAPTFTMRVFSMEPGGNTPFHRHEYEHEILILKGSGLVHFQDTTVELSPGTALLVNPNEWHGFKASATEGMEMVCLVPNKAYHGIKPEPGDWPAS